MSDPLEKLGSSGPAVGAGAGAGVGSSELATFVARLRRRKWLILGITLAVPSIVGFVVSRQPKVYEASASIVIEITVPQYLGPSFKDVVEIEPSWWSSRENLETEFRTLRSESQSLSVAKVICGHLNDPGAKAGHAYLGDNPCGDQAAIARTARRLRGMLRVEPVKESRIVNLTVRSESPQFCAFVANVNAQVYIDRNLERRLSQSKYAADWLESQHGGLEDQLHNAEQALVDFKRRNNLVAVSIEDDQNDLTATRKRLQGELTGIEVKLITIRARRELFANLKTSDPITEFNPAVTESPFATKLKEVYLEEYGKLLELRSKYLEKHPLVVAFETRLAEVRNNLLREIENTRKTVEAEYQMLTKQANDLRTALDITTKKALQLESRASDYNQLRRELERLTKLAEQVGGRESETSLVSHLKTNNVRMMDAAAVPGAPSSPDVPRAVGIAIAVGLLLGVGLALILESLDNTVKSQDDLEKTVGVPFLGLIPSIELDAKGQTGRPPLKPADYSGQAKDIYVWLNPKSSIAECCRSIRTNLLFMSPDKPPRTLLVTSAGPQEGKTTVAVNLAITLAQSGLSVLLVDTDMRRPRLHKALGIPAAADGVSKAVVGECDVFSVIRTTDIPNLSLLPCGACPPNPAELLHSERFKRMVDDLLQRYDRVIFDSPPVGAVTDPAILARLTDGTVLVAKAGRTNRHALIRTRQQVTVEGRHNLLGCIINDLDVSKRGPYGSYYYYYYSRYGTYYSQDESAGRASSG